MWFKIEAAHLILLALWVYLRRLEFYPEITEKTWVVDVALRKIPVLGTPKHELLSVKPEQFKCLLVFRKYF